MELIGYLLVVTLISLGSFWLLGLGYGLLRRPAIYFPLSLAAKMAACTVLGSLMFMVGGVVLSTLVFNGAMKKRPDYRQWPTLLTGALISIIGIVVIYLSAIPLAWTMLD